MTMAHCSDLTRTSDAEGFQVVARHLIGSLGGLGPDEAVLKIGQALVASADLGVEVLDGGEHAVSNGLVFTIEKKTHATWRDLARMGNRLMPEDPRH